MSEKSKKSKKSASDKTEVAAATVRPIPEKLPEELLPLYDWWHAQGKQSAVIVVILVAAIGIGMLYRHHTQAKGLQAGERLLAAHSTEDLEVIVSQYGGTKAGSVAQLQLAKAYFDEGRYDDALARYDAFARKSSNPFAAIAVLGRAHVLEAQGKIDEAQAAFAAFRQENSDHFLTPQAYLGEARCLAIAGDKQAASALLDKLIAIKSGTPWEDIADNLKEVVARYEKRAPRSLFDQADLLSAEDIPPFPLMETPIDSDQATNPPPALPFVE